MSTQKANSDVEIERTERELARMRGNLSNDMQTWQQREMNAEIASEQLELQVSKLRADLQNDVHKMLDYVCKFKVHIQESVEGMDAFMEEEQEAEMAFDDKWQKDSRVADVDMCIEEKIEEEEEEL